MAGILDKIKGMFGGSKSDSASGGGLDDVKDQAGAVKDQVDDLVEQHGDKIPDSVEGAYDKVSDQAEKIIPGDDDNDAT